MKKIVFLSIAFGVMVGCASPRLADSNIVTIPAVSTTSVPPADSTSTTSSDKASTLFPVVVIEKKTPPPPPEPITPSNQTDRAFEGERVAVLPALTVDNPPAASSEPVMIDATRRVEGYILRPMDQIIVNILDPIRQSTEDIINEQGFITLQHLGRIQAAGHTTSSLEEAISKAYLDAEIFNRITVNVLVPLRFYSVQGEVNRPSRYPLSGVLTLLEAISDAGNFTEYADRRRVDIIRNGQSSSYNYNEALQDPSKNPVIQPNDIIRVRRGW